MAGGERASVNLAQLVLRFRNELPAHMELVAIQAKIARAKYLALIDAGFNESEALELVKANPS